MNPFLLKLFKTSAKSYVKGFLIGAFLNRSPSVRNSNDFGTHLVKLNFVREMSEEALNRILTKNIKEKERTEKTNYLLASFISGVVIGPNKKTVVSDDIFQNRRMLNIKDRLKVGAGYASFNFFDNLIFK